MRVQDVASDRISLYQREPSLKPTAHSDSLIYSLNKFVVFLTSANSKKVLSGQEGKGGARSNPLPYLINCLLVDLSSFFRGRFTNPRPDLVLILGLVAWVGQIH